MSNPHDGQNQPPFVPGDDGPYGQPSGNPAPPPMSSPYGAPLGNSGSNSGGSAQRQPPRFPDLNQPAPPQQQPQQPWQPQGPPQPPASHLPTGVHQGLPPFVSPTDQGATIPPTPGLWGSRDPNNFAPPQFAYNPDQPLSVPPPVAAPPPKDRKRLVIAVSAAVAVLAAVGVGAAMMLNKDDSPKPAATAGPTGGPMSSDSRTQVPSTAPVWSVPAATDQSAKSVVGSWLVDGHAVVRGDAGALHSFDAQSGQPQWTYTVPDQGSVICAMSQFAIRKIGVVQYGPKDNCNNLAAIDTDSGKAVWSLPVPGGSGASVSSGGDVVEASAGTTVTLWNAADGKKLWDADLGKANPPCKLNQSNVKGAVVILIADCGKGATVLAKDAHNGKDLWQAPLPPDGLNGAQITIVSAAYPTIVHVEAPAGAQPFDRYYTFESTKGTAMPPLDGVGAFGKLDLTVGSDSRQQIPHMQGNTLIAATAAKDPATGGPPQAGVVAVDLNSAKVLWQAPATFGNPVAITSLDAGRVTVFDGGDASHPPRLLAFATPNGSPLISGIDTTLGPDWTGPATAYLTGNRLILLPGAPEKGLSLMAFGFK